MKTSQWVGRVLPLVLLGMIALVVWLSANRQELPPVALACGNLVSGCAASVAGRDILFGTDGAIRPLKPFAIWVRASGANKVEARFTMEGMDMGFNLYTLRPDRDGVFRVTATLPICVTGRRDWIMTLDIDGQRIAVPFVTEL